MTTPQQTRSIFEFLASNEIEHITSKSGIGMIYHSNWTSKYYRAGAVVRYKDVTTTSVYIAIVDTDKEPLVTSDWEVLVNDITLPYHDMVDVNGLNMVDSNGQQLRAV